MKKPRSILIAIPSYWTFGRKNDILHKAYELYDHPTEEPRHETLSRLLESLKCLDHKGLKIKISILVATIHDIKRYEKIVEELVEGTNLDVELLFERDVVRIKEEIENAGYKKVAKQVDLIGYPKVRNLALILAKKKRVDAVYFLDDDVIIDDPNVLIRLIGQMRKGYGVVGGPYKDLKKDIRKAFWKVLWRKNVSGGTEANSIGKILGGNMLIHKDVFEKVSFDPWIKRGEDMDYAISAYAFGEKVMLDQEAVVLHRPPINKRIYRKHYWSKLRADAYRFFYTREKLKNMGVERGMLNPYLQKFTGASLSLRVAVTSLLLSLDSLINLDLRSWKDNILNFFYVFGVYQRYAKKHKEDYLSFLEEWQAVMEHLG
jgi:hypothetical protein